MLPNKNRQNDTDEDDAFCRRQFWSKDSTVHQVLARAQESGIFGGSGRSDRQENENAPVNARQAIGQKG